MKNERLGSASKRNASFLPGFNQQRNSARGGKSPASRSHSTSFARLAEQKSSSKLLNDPGMYPNIDFKTDEDFAIKILDNMIQVEEDMNGFSMYNRGKNLKTSLINPERVR